MLLRKRRTFLKELSAYFTKKISNRTTRIKIREVRKAPQSSKME
jgi:hypothetical protein